MYAQRSNPMYNPSPPYPASLAQARNNEDIKAGTIHIERTQQRKERAASVISGMSAEDMEAAETLKSLGKDVHSPRLQESANQVAISTIYGHNDPEPLLSLITSQYPLAASVINGSISVYKSAQQFTPGGKWTEENVGLPLARNAARLTGVETAARWALSNTRKPPNQTQTPDMEKGYLELTPNSLPLRETLPAYNAGDRSPPYSESQVVLSRDQPPSGWQQRLVITTSGLGVAMSEESIRSLKYCLQWLRWANKHLGTAIAELRSLLHHCEHRPSIDSQPMSITSITNQTPAEDSALVAKIAELKADVLTTLKKVVHVVSTYAGSALPSNARDLVHHHLVSLPQRFTLASGRTSQEEREKRDEPSQNAGRALVLAQEGLDMMNQVTRVVNDTLVSAEDWLEKLGKRRPTESSQPQQMQTQRQHTQIDPALTDAQGDRKMEM